MNEIPRRVSHSRQDYPRRLLADSDVFAEACGEMSRICCRFTFVQQAREHLLRTTLATVAEQGVAVPL